MTGPTHLAAGLIIGQLTGDYPTAIACSILIDIDHLVPIVKHGLLFKPKALRLVMTSPQVITDPKNGKKEDERNYLHNVFALVILSSIVFLFSVPVGIVFAIAYVGHLCIDMIDKSDFYPFFPLKSVNIKGIIGYYSSGELILALGMYIIRVILFTSNIHVI